VKKGSGKAAGAAEAPPLAVATHPRAALAVARFKSWAGLAGFVLGGLVSLNAGVPEPEALLRALGVGLLMWLVAWALAVAVWKQVLLAELKAATERRRAEYEELLRKRREADEGISGDAEPATAVLR
jgi:hypothetical protein